MNKKACFAPTIKTHLSGCATFTSLNQAIDFKFSHIIYSEKGEGTRTIWKRKNARKGSTRKTDRPLLELLKTWIEQSYFDRQVNALEIFKRLKAESSIKFRVSDIEKCMKILCGSRQALLQKDSIDGVLRYWKEEL